MISILLLIGATIAICVLIIQNKKLDKEIDRKKELKAKRQKEEIPNSKPISDTFEITDHIFSPKAIPSKYFEQLEFDSVIFEQEPDNKYDPNAVKVMTDFYNESSDSYEDYCIGYLYRGRLQDTVNIYINGGRDCDISAFVSDVDTEPDDSKRFIELTVKFKK